MRIFLTGATGFIGTAISAQLIAAGHEVVGLTRSQQGAEVLAAAGIEPFYGDIADVDSLRRGAMDSDGVIHTAFNHDFSAFIANCEMDRQAIIAMAEALSDTQRPLLITSGVGLGSSEPGIIAVENHFQSSACQPTQSLRAGRDRGRRNGGQCVSYPAIAGSYSTETGIDHPPD